MNRTIEITGLDPLISAEDEPDLIQLNLTVDGHEFLGTALRTSAGWVQQLADANTFKMLPLLSTGGTIESRDAAILSLMDAALEAAEHNHPLGERIRQTA